MSVRLYAQQKDMYCRLFKRIIEAKIINTKVQTDTKALFKIYRIPQGIHNRSNEKMGERPFDVNGPPERTRNTHP